MTTETVHVCSICGEFYRGQGNDAEPVRDGSCCDDCNERYVIPTRLEELRAAEREARRQRWRLH